MNDASTVSDHYAGSGSEEYFAYQQQYVRRNNWVSSRFFIDHVSSGDTVVDYGCGTGWLLKLLDPGARLGIEPNPAARTYAAEIDVETVASPTEVSDNFADVVISNHALEHSLAPLDEFRQIRRIVKEGGKVVICLPIDDWRKQRKIDLDDPNHHLYTWTPLLLSNLMGEAGLKVTEARAFSYLQPPPNWHMDKLPRAAFDLLSALHGRAYRYHQLVAVARPAGQ
ncbi:MAG: class I SAM-dependent methyltransferase [Thermoleophilaceae bacterium]|nr:class I SAM-dependent methyltransferase [Thermoleophilaceae bacterium]